LILTRTRRICRVVPHAVHPDAGSREKSSMSRPSAYRSILALASAGLR
jgi:hypothetical protein